MEFLNGYAPLRVSIPRAAEGRVGVSLPETPRAPQDPPAFSPSSPRSSDESALTAQKDERKMGQLADRISALAARIDPEWTLEQDEVAAIAARAAIIELDNESLAAINARVEQENDLLRAVEAAADDLRSYLEQENDLLRAVEAAADDIPVGKWPKLDAAINALLDWRESQDAPHG